MNPPEPNTAKGIVLTLIATLGIVLMNTCAKMSSVSMNPVEMIFYRGLVALAILVPYMGLTHSRSVFRTRRPLAHLIRALIGNIGVGFVFWAYTLMPMADATALMFAAPLFVTALSPLLLKERVDGHRWAAVIVGFGGVLLILRPSGAIFLNLASLVGLAAALCIALVAIVLRNLGRTDHPLTTVFYFLVIGVLLTAPYALFFGHRPGIAVLPWLIGIGLFAAIQQVTKTAAFQYAEASLLAPYTYTSIVWATLTGWIFWKDWPTMPVILGTVVVIGSNFFILWRE